MKYESPFSNSLIFFKYASQRSGSRSLGHKVWYEWKGLITRNFYVKKPYLKPFKWHGKGWKIFSYVDQKSCSSPKVNYLRAIWKGLISWVYIPKSRVQKLWKRLKFVVQQSPRIPFQGIKVTENLLWSHNYDWGDLVSPAASYFKSSVNQPNNTYW